MKKRNGLTLVELILSLALVSMIIVVGTNLLLFGTKAHSKTIDEFDIQSNVRLVSQNVNNAIRDSSAVFLLDKSFPGDSMDLETYFTEGWNYLMLSEDKDQLIELVWDVDKHIKRIVVNSLPDVNYNLEYSKDGTTDGDRLLKYTLDLDINGNTRIINSELEAINSLQIVDRSYGGIANTLAYRSDPRLTDIGIAQAALSFVIDKSGSMTKKDLKSTDDEGNVTTHRRIDVLKEEATKMIEALGEYENIYLSISPFSNTANSISKLPDEEDNTISDNLNVMLNLRSNKDTFISESDGIIKNIIAHGGTNTGDGMRRGFSSIVSFNDEIKNEDKITKNFMIILVDGDGTFSSVTERIDNEISNTNWSSTPDRGTITLNSGTPNEREYKHYKTERIGIITRRHYFKCDGASRNSYYTDLGKNVGDYSGTDSTSGAPNYGLGTNDYKVNGKVIGKGIGNDDKGAKEYVSIIGEMIKDYKNTRDDGIETFVIGFSNEPSLAGLQHIADATQSTQGTDGTGDYKYFKADTAEALEAILDEIKFQISEALWHIGGPN